MYIRYIKRENEREKRGDRDCNTYCIREWYTEREKERERERERERE